MGFLDLPMRVKLPDDEWIDVKRVSAVEFREMQKEAATAEPEFEGDDKDTAENFHILRQIRGLIVAWSDEAPLTPENLERLPLDINTMLVQQIGAGASGAVPLPITSTWSESSLDEVE
jgi:hypothetical protein